MYTALLLSVISTHTFIPVRDHSHPTFHKLEQSVQQYPDSLNLSSWLAYPAADRNQGTCGDCWVWANTGAVEIMLNEKAGNLTALSVQYFNSNYDGGACCGGSNEAFATW